MVIGLIAERSPAVLGVQEALRFQLDEISEALPMFDFVGVGRDDGVDAGEFAAVFYDTRRFDVVDSGTFWFSEQPTVPGSKSWGNNIPRICTWARLLERTQGATLYVYNVHWDHESQPSRERGAELLMSRIAARASPDDPVIVLGDFNAGPTNPAFRRLVDTEKGQLVDTFEAPDSNADSTGTFHGFSGIPGSDRIDAVLASPRWVVTSSAIVRTQADGRFPSDHFPVTAVLRLPAH